MMSTRHLQHKRPNKYKPFVGKPWGGMWWAQVYRTDGEYLTKCFFTHADALAKAYEYAELNREVTA